MEELLEYNRDFLSRACRMRTRWPKSSCSPFGRIDRRSSCRPGVRQLRPVKGRIAYSLAAIRTAISRRIDVVFCGHLFMAPLAAAIAKLVGAPLWIQVHGIEAWQELSRLHRWAIETAALITSVSRYTRRRLLEWVGIDPARVKVLPNTVDLV